MKVVLRPERVEGTAIITLEGLIMANTIDFTTLAIGALIGVGCKEQLKACAKVAATTAASLASSAALAANTVAAEVYESEKTQAPQQPQQPQGTNGN